MGLLDRLTQGAAQRPAGAPSSEDDAAIARYRYMLKTAPPQTIEQAHAEAFSQLTPEQRGRVLEELSNATPALERPAFSHAADSPGELARLATRAEIRQPGVLERVFGRVQPGAATAMGPSMGAMFGGTLLSSMAGTVLGSMIAQHFFNSHPDALHQFGAFPDSSTSGSDFSDRVSSTLAGNDAHTSTEGSSDDGIFGDSDTDLGGGDFDSGGDFGGDTFDV
jgi:hypothetical protein